MRVLRRDAELIERFVGKEYGRNDALGAGRTQPLELAVELAGILREAAEIGFGVGRGFDWVIGVEEVRSVDVCADVLDHDVGRVAIAADGDVAVREGEALERGAVGAADGVDAGADGEGEAGFVDRFDARQVGLHRGRNRRTPAALWSLSLERIHARGPVSIPSEVAPSGPRRRRFSATELSNALA